LVKYKYFLKELKLKAKKAPLAQQEDLSAEESDDEA